ncbi:hypothetical protein BXZ70DRAFT_501461 [Cristinia sonorae]|uniref:Secreted protein n=1 Tax=Cristinia sonorae TaxID=1940300 RepID=A0A8K0UIM8_9AGAR|nr:hypothetical protein BXZ70DRAFT_501461 [Cristinia sonorae]
MRMTMSFFISLSLAPLSAPSALLSLVVLEFNNIRWHVAFMRVTGMHNIAGSRHANRASRDQELSPVNEVSMRSCSYSSTWHSTPPRRLWSNRVDMITSETVFYLLGILPALTPPMIIGCSAGMFHPHRTSKEHVCNVVPFIVICRWVD